VSSGGVIGHVGMSGNAEFPHLHFEMRTELLPGMGLKSRLNPKYGIGTAYYQCD
jgi:murein DD-endopeptidase MepM/ murein hydrolase activator NlpD